jgi:hypothetical protein
MLAAGLNTGLPAVAACVGKGREGRWETGSGEDETRVDKGCGCVRPVLNLDGVRLEQGNGIRIDRQRV